MVYIISYEVIMLFFILGQPVEVAVTSKKLWVAPSSENTKIIPTSKSSIPSVFCQRDLASP